jgi:pyruvate dehydrogenase E2 component (dihydrolipoamide acetyltransferase)
MFVQEALASRRTVHAVELPSHGQSDVAPAAASVDALADRVLAAIDAVAPGRLHLAGHSLGGRLALRLAARLGGRVRSLALIAPAGLGSTPKAGFVDAFLAADKRRPMKEAMRMLVADEDLITSDMVEGALASKRIDGAQAALGAIAATSLGDKARVGTEEDLAAVSAPILRIWGAEDQVVPAPEAGEHHILDGVGHIPQMEAPAKVANLLKAHMEAAE